MLQTNCQKRDAVNEGIDVPLCYLLIPPGISPCFIPHLERLLKRDFVDLLGLNIFFLYFWATLLNGFTFSGSRVWTGCFILKIDYGAPGESTRIVSQPECGADMLCGIWGVDHVSFVPALVSYCWGDRLDCPESNLSIQLGDGSRDHNE